MNHNPHINRGRSFKPKNRNKILKKRIRKFCVLSFIFLLFFAVLTGIAACIMAINLNTTDKADKSNYSLNVISHDKAETKTYGSDEIYIDENIYVPVSSIQSITDITTKKDGNTVGIIFPESGEYADFILGTRKCYINGVSNEIELSAQPKFIKNVLYVPVDFFEIHVSGFILEHNKDKESYTISKDLENAPSFVAKKAATTLALSESDTSSETNAPMSFKLDLSAYEKYMNPQNRDEYLFIVSTTHPLDENYIPTDLVGSVFTRKDGRATQKLREYACYALEAFLKEASANGFDDVTVTSGYRSYDYQSQLFQNEIALTGSEEEAAKSVNPPGCSEHQSGLCIDMHNLGAASTAFGDTKAAKWLAENAHYFGFILRYPKNKTTITGIGYEPWHFRYVGRYHATKMYDLGMCLEEYVDYINK